MPKSAIKVGRTLGIIGGNSIMKPYNLPDGTRYNQSAIAIETYRKMRKDYQISACLNVLAFTIQKMDWYLTGSKPKVREFCEKSIKKIWNQLVKVMSKSFWAGYSPATKVFEYDEILKGINYKNIRDLAPETCRIKLDDNGNFNGFKQYPAQTFEQDVEPKYAFWYANQVEDGNLYGRSMLEAAYNAWYYSEIMHLFANRYYERFGEPAVVTRGPGTEDVKDSNGTALDAISSMKSVGEGLKSHSVVGIPSDRDDGGNYLFDIQYLESQMRGVDFDTYLKRLDMEKSRAIFVPDLLLGTGRVGSYELGKEHKATFINGVMGMFDDFITYINKYITPQLVEYNFGTRTEIPEFNYLPLSKTSEDSLVAVFNAALKGDPNILDIERLAPKLGIPLRDAQELAKINDEQNKNQQTNQPNNQQSNQNTNINPNPNDNKQNITKINPDVRKKQFQRVENYVRNVYKSASPEDETIRELNNTRIGFPEMYEDKELYMTLESKIKNEIVNGYKNQIALNKVMDNVYSLLGFDK
jgi:hypothetical protein